MLAEGAGRTGLAAADTGASADCELRQNVLVKRSTAATRSPATSNPPSKSRGYRRFCRRTLPASVMMEGASVVVVSGVNAAACLLRLEPIPACIRGGGSECNWGIACEPVISSPQTKRSTSADSAIERNRRFGSRCAQRENHSSKPVGTAAKCEGTGIGSVQIDKSKPPSVSAEKA